MEKEFQAKAEHWGEKVGDKEEIKAGMAEKEDVVEQ